MASQFQQFHGFLKGLEGSEAMDGLEPLNH